MKKNTMKVLSISVLVLGISMVFVGCTKGDSIGDIVSLENQKEEIDYTLLVKSVGDLRKFEGKRWLDNGKILGIRNEPMGKSENIEASISIYDPVSDSFDDLVTCKTKERIFIGDDLKEHVITYSNLLDGDYIKKLCNFNVLDINKKENKTILTNTTASSDVKNNMIYIAKEFKLYRYEFGKEIEEISLPEKLLNDLKDFDTFQFKDYLEMYYKYDVLEQKSLDKIELQYEDRRDNNAIRMLTNLEDSVLIESESGKSFIYNVNDKSYSLMEDYIYEDEDEDKDLIENKPSIIEYEVKSDGNKIIWKLDSKGNREKVIENISTYSNVSLSPDESKVAYYFDENEGNKALYIYNLRTDEKTRVYLDVNPEVRDRIYWNNNSDKFFIVGRTYIGNEAQENITSLINMN